MGLPYRRRSGLRLLNDVERLFMPPPDRMGLSKMKHDKLIFCERFRVQHQSAVLTDLDIDAIREWEYARGFCFGERVNE